MCCWRGEVDALLHESNGFSLLPCSVYMDIRYDEVHSRCLVYQLLRSQVVAHPRYRTVLKELLSVG